MEGMEARENKRTDVLVRGFRASWDPKIKTASPPEPSTAARSTVPIRIDTAGGRLREVHRPLSIMKLFFGTEAGRLHALKPVTIRVWKGEEFWFAENDKVDVFATGKTADQAVEEFSRHLVAFYRHYKELDEREAVGEARRLKDLFQAEFAETAP